VKSASKLCKYLQELEHAQEVSLAADLCDDIARKVAKKVRLRSQLLGVDAYVNYSLIAKDLRALRLQIQEPSHSGRNARGDDDKPPERHCVISKVIQSIRLPGGGRKDSRRKRRGGKDPSDKHHKKICALRQKWAAFIWRRAEHKIESLVRSLVVSKAIQVQHPSTSQILTERYANDRLLIAEIEHIVYEYQEARVWGGAYIVAGGDKADPKERTEKIQFPERLMNLLVLESLRDKRGLREFLMLAFKRWRQHDDPNSTWKRQCAVFDIATALARNGGVQASGKQILNCLQQIGEMPAVGDERLHESRNLQIRQDLSRSVRHAQRARSPFRDKVQPKPLNLSQEAA
jgi:hypothetical protein